MEPAFVAQGSNSSGSPNWPPLYFALNNCSALTASDQSTLQQIGEAITNMTGFPVACASLPPAWWVGWEQCSLIARPTLTNNLAANCPTAWLQGKHLHADERPGVLWLGLL